MTQDMAQNRKDDHLRLALDQQANSSTNSFDQVRLVHRPLAKLSLNEIDTSTIWAGQQHRSPLYINAMTGGSEKAKVYNQQLARLAHEANLAMGVGSISAALAYPDLIDTFTVIRQENPNGFVLANLGAHHNLENAKRAVDLIRADALQIHLNVCQEIIMPEGDRDFSTWQDNIQDIVENLGLPVIVKEVGFGMDQSSIQELIRLGVQTIDISGRGGTNFAQIENDRNQQFDFSVLKNWGQTTVESLLESLPFQSEVSFLASGGIRNFLDVTKALALGAKACGMAGKILQMVDQLGIDQSLKQIEAFDQALKHSLLLLSCSNINDLQNVDLVLTGQNLEWAMARGIDFQGLAQRNKIN